MPKRRDEKQKIMADKANELLSELSMLFPKVDEKTRKMIKRKTAGLSLEHEHEGELRIFCVFNDNKAGTYRVTQGDVCFVDNLVSDISFSNALASMAIAGIEAGETVNMKYIQKQIDSSKK